MRDVWFNTVQDVRSCDQHMQQILGAPSCIFCKPRKYLRVQSDTLLFINYPEKNIKHNKIFAYCKLAFFKEGGGWWG